MAEIVPEFNIKEVESFHLDCIYKGKTKQRSVILKTLEKIVQPAKENFKTFCKKHIYELWRKLFPNLLYMSYGGNRSRL